MKRVMIFAGALLTFNAHAGECIVLDYQELKEMGAEDATKAYCTAQASGTDGLIRGMRADMAGAKELSRTLGVQGEKCLLQARRIESILTAKGVQKETLEATCKALSNK